MGLKTPGQLFRQAQHSLEQRVKAGAEEGEVLQQSPVWMRATTWGLMGTAAFGIGWLAIAQTEEIVVAPGKLEPLGGVREIQIPINGVVKTLDVKEGEQVKKGQILLTLDPEASSQRQKSVSQSLQLTQEQLRLKQEELKQYLQLNTTEQAKLQRNLQLNEEILERYARLEAQGASAELQLLEQRNRVEEIRGQLEQTQVDRLRQVAVLDQATQQLRSQLAQLRGDLSEQNMNIRYQTVTSPVDGVVFELKPQGAGFVNRDSMPVLKVVPFDKLEARVEIQSSDIGFVHVGQAADLSIDSFPATDFGVLEGTVRRVGSDALPPDQQKQTYRYPADIRLTNQQLKLRDGNLLPLQVGMSLTANIKLRKVSYLQLLLGSFKDKADSLRQI
ncbi:HlyD family efflux transporter periplasmic adaptor subunit [Synechococcus sp. LA31]|nr:HlyD family efflux transporter periplasmic adaptor subunit [Synechococcus sp. LA31]QVV67051.1 HlyD family efflux transporter periplasmic adaptor subunit [Synechococcus sp. LA31]